MNDSRKPIEEPKQIPSIPMTKMQTGLVGVDFYMEYQESTKVKLIQTRIKEILEE